MEEYCEQTNIEVDNIDDCIRSLCSHLVKFHKVLIQKIQSLHGKKLEERCFG